MIAKASGLANCAFSAKLKASFMEVRWVQVTGEPLGYGYLERCSDLKLKHASFWAAWQMLLQNKGFTFLEVINDSDTCSDAVNVYLNIIYYIYVFFLKQDKMHQWLKAGHKHVAHHIAFTRQQAKCCGGEVLVTSPDASYGLATLTRLAPSTHPKSSRNEALFPFTIMIISPFFYLQGCFKFLS